MIVLFCGPECTGKSKFSKFLAMENGFPIIEEFARTYLNAKPNNYSYEFVDLCAIYKEHENIFQEKSHSAKHIILDTDLMNLNFWAEEKFGENILGLNTALNKRNYDLVFLCKPDFPWVTDPLRENPKDRNRLFFRYQKKLETLAQDYIVLKGTEKEKEELIIQQIYAMKS